MQKTFRYLSFLFVVACFYACTYADLEVKPADSYRYFPINVGDVRVYQQVTTNYAVGQKPVTDTILVQESITKVETEEYQNTYTVLREIKRKTDFEFKPDFTYLIITSPKEVVSTEKNIATVRLSYPLNVGAEWNLNRLNSNDEKKATVLPAYDAPENILTKEKIFKLDIEDFESTIDRKKFNRYYGLDIGLLFLEDTHINFEQDEKGGKLDPKTGKYIIESGQSLTLRLLEYTPGKK